MFQYDAPSSPDLSEPNVSMPDLDEESSPRNLNSTEPDELSSSSRERPASEPQSSSVGPSPRSTSAPRPKFGDRSPEAEIWPMYVKVADDYDKEQLERWNTSTDNFILFTTLFSAILTAFIVLSLSSLQPDYTQITADALTIVSAQLQILTSGQGQGGVSPYQPPQFSASNSDVLTNALWIISLTISLLATVVSTLVKQWLSSYGAQLPLKPQERARMRHFRYHGVTRWHMETIIEMLPIAMHASVIIFLAGFVVYLSERSPIISYLVLAIALLGVIIYLFFAVAPLIFLDCPFVSPVTTGLDFLMTRLQHVLVRSLSKFPGLPRKLSDSLATWKLHWKGIRRRRTGLIEDWLKTKGNTDRLDVLALGWLQSHSNDQKINITVFLTLFDWELPQSEARSIAQFMEERAASCEGDYGAPIVPAVLAAVSNWSCIGRSYDVVRAATDRLTSFETSSTIDAVEELSLLFYSVRRSEWFVRAFPNERTASVFQRLVLNKGIETIHLSRLLAYFHSLALIQATSTRYIQGDEYDSRTKEAGVKRALSVVCDTLKKQVQVFRPSGDKSRSLSFFASACAFLRAFEDPSSLPSDLPCPDVIAFKDVRSEKQFLTRTALQIASTFNVGSRDTPTLGWHTLKSLLASGFGEYRPPFRSDPAVLALQPVLRLFDAFLQPEHARQEAWPVLDVMNLCIILGTASRGTEILLLDSEAGYAPEVIKLKFLRPLTAAGAHNSDVAHLVTMCMNSIVGMLPHELLWYRARVERSAYRYMRRHLSVIHKLWSQMILARLADSRAEEAESPLWNLAAEHMLRLWRLDRNLVVKSQVLELLHRRLDRISSPWAARISHIVPARQRERQILPFKLLRRNLVPAHPHDLERALRELEAKESPSAGSIMLEAP